METPPFPSFVRQVLGGREICPHTGREHFQGAVQCWQQVRYTAFKDWLPTAHLENARKEEALKLYAMKAATAVGEKNVVQNTLKHFSANEICEQIALAVTRQGNQTDRQTDSFWRGVKAILMDSPELAGQLMNPSLRNFYKNTESVWLSRAIVLQHGEKNAVIEAKKCECGRDECEDCWDDPVENLCIEYNNEQKVEGSSS